MTLQTERLLLRPFRASDTDAYAAMCADPEVMRFLGDRGVLNREDAWRQMAMLVGHWELRGYGMWAVEERRSGGFVGRVGLHYPEGYPGREVSWALARPFWGRGFAFEAARASLAWAFEVRSWDRAISLIDPENSRSIQLAERLGQTFERWAERRGRSVALYSMDRAGWRASQPSPDTRSHQ